MEGQSKGNTDLPCQTKARHIIEQSQSLLQQFAILNALFDLYFELWTVWTCYQVKHTKTLTLDPPGYNCIRGDHYNIIPIFSWDNTTRYLLWDFPKASWTPTGHSCEIEKESHNSKSQ